MLRAGGAKVASLGFKKRKEKVKPMKTLDTAKLINIAQLIFLTVMLAYLAMLFIRFIIGCIMLRIWFCASYLWSVFNDCYAWKRVGHRVIHDRKFALFTGRPFSTGV